MSSIGFWRPIQLYRPLIIHSYLSLLFQCVSTGVATKVISGIKSSKVIFIYEIQERTYPILSHCLSILIVVNKIMYIELEGTFFGCINIKSEKNTFINNPRKIFKSMFTNILKKKVKTFIN